MEPGLGARAIITPAGATYPNGCHICEVEIDPDTGIVGISRYAVVDDVGRVINPLLLKGQLHGGIAQGAGQALYEIINYDSGNGQLLCGSFMDYCMPRAADFPCSRSPATRSSPTANPLGVKGAGEAGTVGALPAVMNAINDALAPLGIRHFEMPATPERLWRAIRDAQGGKSKKATTPVLRRRAQQLSIWIIHNLVGRTRPTAREECDEKIFCNRLCSRPRRVALSLVSGATPVSAADDELVVKAKKVVSEAINGLVATTNPKKSELELTIDDFQPVTGWVGPKSPVKAPEHKKVVAISCATVAPFCANVTQGAVEAAKALGWDATYIDGKASINGYVQAFETAINMKPDGIITMAIPESQLRRTSPKRMPPASSSLALHPYRKTSRSRTANTTPTFPCGRI